jgi:hypothetical protein
MIDRIYDTYIDEDDLRDCDMATRDLRRLLRAPAPTPARVHRGHGRLPQQAKLAKNESIVKTCYQKRVPIFCPRVQRLLGGFGIVHHQQTEAREGRGQVAFDWQGLPRADRHQARVQGHRPAHDGRRRAEELRPGHRCGRRTPQRAQGRQGPRRHRHAQVRHPDHRRRQRDGALSGSTLREACSWGKVDVVHEQMVWAEATLVLPLMAVGRRPRRLPPGRSLTPLRQRNAPHATAHPRRPRHGHARGRRHVHLVPEPRRRRGRAGARPRPQAGAGNRGAAGARAGARAGRARGRGRLPHALQRRVPAPVDRGRGRQVRRRVRHRRGQHACPHRGRPGPGRFRRQCRGDRAAGTDARPGRRHAAAGSASWTPPGDWPPTTRRRSGSAWAR